MRRLRSSFGGKLTLAVILAATVAIAIFLSTAFLRLEQGLLRQSEQLGKLAEASIAEKLDGKARLASAQLELLQTRVSRLLSLIALRADVAEAIRSRNVVAIHHILAAALQDSQIDNVLVVDHKMHVIGSSSDETDLVAANRALSRSPFLAPLRRILSAGDRSDPTSVRYVVQMEPPLAAAFHAGEGSGLTFVSISPVFDDFGDPSAVLIAARTLRTVEPELAQFTEAHGEGVAVLSESKTISTAGLDVPNLTLETADNLPFQVAPDYSLLARCSDFRRSWRVCALVPFSTLADFRDQLVVIAEGEGRSIALWLLAMATLALLVCGAGTFGAARRLTAPLIRITEALRSTAVGDWRAPVEGQTRTDEIGEIARAVIILQRSVRERQQLASEAADGRLAHAQKTRLEVRTTELESGMRALLIDLTDSVEHLDEAAHALSRICGIVEGEADEATFVLDGIASRLSDVLRSAHGLAGAEVWRSAELGHMGAALEKLVQGFAREVVCSARQVGQLADLACSILESTAAVEQKDAWERSQQRIAIASTLRGCLNQARQRLELQAARLTSNVRGSADGADVKIVNDQSTMACGGSDHFALAGDDAIAPTQLQSVREGLGNLRASLDSLRTSARGSRAASAEMTERALAMADEARKLDTMIKHFLSEMRSGESGEHSPPAGLSNLPVLLSAGPHPQTQDCQILCEDVVVTGQLSSAPA